MKPLHGGFRKTILQYSRLSLRRKLYVLLPLVILVLVPIGYAITVNPVEDPPASTKQIPDEEHRKNDTAQLAPSKPEPASAAPQVLAPSVAPAAQKILFGIGPQADSAQAQRLTAEAPVKMLTSWYNGPNDLGFMRGWQDDRIPQAYSSGYSLHLIVWTDKPEGPLETKYGPACGRHYPLSDRFVADMKELATIYRGSGTLYVSMFSEVQTFPCEDNVWQGSENYYRALMDQYQMTRNIFKTHAPNSQVSLTWGGWQAQWDDASRGGGRSLIPHFAEVLNASDFQSFQAMDSKDNFKDISAMTSLLHRYGDGRVMVAHYKPDNGSQETWSKDLRNVFTPSNIAVLMQNGLFAFSFMDGVNMNANEDSYQQAKTVVTTFGQ